MADGRRFTAKVIFLIVCSLAHQIAKYTSAAIPKVLFWSSETSDLGYEYTVMTRLRGKILSHQLETLSPDALDSAIATLCDVHLELSSIPLPALAPAPSRDSAGGTPVTTADGTTSQQCVGTIRFARTASGEIHEDDYVLGPMLEETYWEPVEVDRWWTDTGATVEQLNPKGPYSHWKDYLAACFEVRRECVRAVVALY